MHLLTTFLRWPRRRLVALNLLETEDQSTRGLDRRPLSIGLPDDGAFQQRRIEPGQPDVIGTVDERHAQRDSGRAVRLRDHRPIPRLVMLHEAERMANRIQQDDEFQVCHLLCWLDLGPRRPDRFRIPGRGFQVRRREIEMDLLPTFLGGPGRALVVRYLLEHERPALVRDRREGVAVVLDLHPRQVVIEAHQPLTVRTIDHDPFNANACHRCLPFLV